MNIDKFLEYLNRTAPHFTWSLGPEGEIGGYLINREYWLIAVPTIDYSFCPLSAVYLLYSQKFLDNWDWDTIARRLGMENVDAYHIVGAADEINFRPALRARILEAVGLEVN